MPRIMASTIFRVHLSWISGHIALASVVLASPCAAEESESAPAYIQEQVVAPYGVPATEPRLPRSKQQESSEPAPARDPAVPSSQSRRARVDRNPVGGPFLDDRLIHSSKPAVATVVEAESEVGEVTALAPERYGIQAGDIINVSVWREPDLTREVLVSPDGWITFPLAGELYVEGKTVKEIHALLMERLRDYFSEVAITVSLKEILGNRVYVLGKVNRPGVFPFSKSLDVLQALSLAGGPAKFAATDDIRIIRRQGEEQLDFAFRYSDVERGRRLEQNIVLRSGDVIMVP